MFRNYMKVALRNLINQKLYVSINAAGLAIGLSVCLLIIGFVNNELTFENCHENKDRIYRVDGVYHYRGSSIVMANLPSAFGPAFAEAFPETEQVVRIRCLNNVPVEVSQGHAYQEEKVFACEPQLFDVFTLPLKQGRGETALQDPFSAVISSRVAEDRFAGVDPVGQTLTLYDSLQFRITGVLEEIPANTQLRSDLYISHSSLARMGEDVTSWSELFQDHTYLLLRENADPAAIEQKIPGLLEANMEADQARMFDLKVQPLSNIYLHSHLSYELPPNGNVTNTYVFACIAAVILLIACINFVNLTTARTSRRLREVGVRKVLGAERHQLVRQFLSESVFFSFLSMLIGIALFEFARPRLEAFIDRELAISIFGDPVLLSSMLAMIVIVGLISGGYPAMILSRYRPVQILKSGYRDGGKRSLVRRGLVVIQFLAAITLICVTWGVFDQINYSLTRDPGFDKNNVLMVDVGEDFTDEQRTLLKNEVLSANPAFQATIADGLPGENIHSLYGVRPENKADEDPVIINGFRTDVDFVTMLEVELVAGSLPEGESVDGGSTPVLINETAVREFEIENPIGSKLHRSKSDLTVVGVVKDFNMHSAYNEIMPGMIVFSYNDSRVLAVKLPADDVAGGLAAVQAAWKNLFPYRTMEYTFLEDVMAEDYDDAARIGTLFGTFSALAVFVACLGLFGLVSYTAEQRTKELGIRKVLGASVTSLVSLLCKEFALLVATATLLAWPLAWFLIDRWLQDFAYRMDIGLGLFVWAGLLSLGIAFATVSFQSIKTARANPVETLKYE